MEAVVPQEITAELTQILANLVLGDNQIRSKYVLPAITNDSCTNWILVQKRRSTIVSLRHPTSTSSPWPSSPSQRTPKWQVAI